jgi:hypothetical protein
MLLKMEKSLLKALQGRRVESQLPLQATRQALLLSLLRGVEIKLPRRLKEII